MFLWNQCTLFVSANKKYLYKEFLSNKYVNYENVSAMKRPLLGDLCCLKPATLLKQRLWHRCFSVNVAKFLRTPFLTEHLQRVLLAFLRMRLLFYGS